ncbi:hypothetical protein K523DRAFT_397546 [Schizophyllum commune Tattone D]|nr:hypothetical protein K523DRAFT_397546 [Schizophyllum commune Tattone D]
MLWHNTPAWPHGHGCIFTVSIRVLRQWAQDIKGGLLARLRTHYPYPSRHNVQYVFSFALCNRKFADHSRLCNTIEQLRVPFSAREASYADTFPDFQTRQQTTRVTYSESSAGPSHARIWTVQCKVDGQPLGTGVAAQKSVAKEEAARQALQVQSGEPSYNSPDWQKRSRTKGTEPANENATGPTTTPPQSS